LGLGGCELLERDSGIAPIRVSGCNSVVITEGDSFSRRHRRRRRRRRRWKVLQDRPSRCGRQSREVVETGESKTTRHKNDCTGIGVAGCEPLKKENLGLHRFRVRGCNHVVIADPVDVVVVGGGGRGGGGRYRQDLHSSVQ